VYIESYSSSLPSSFSLLSLVSSISAIYKAPFSRIAFLYVTPQYKAFVEDIAIPISLFHPRWLLDGLAVLYKRWIMRWDITYALQPDTSLRHTRDRYRRHREDLILEAALNAIKAHKSLRLD
jgi:hypothetical protein